MKLIYKPLDHCLLPEHTKPTLTNISYVNLRIPCIILKMLLFQIKLSTFCQSFYIRSSLPGLVLWLWRFFDMITLNYREWPIWTLRIMPESVLYSMQNCWIACADKSLFNIRINWWNFNHMIFVMESNFAK